MLKTVYSQQSISRSAFGGIPGYLLLPSHLIPATTDSDGRATAHLVAGGLQGFDAQVVVAKLANSESPIRAGFSLTAFVPGEPGNTRISGIVTDTEDSPLAGVTVRVDGTTRQAVTDAKGKFLITEAPVGPVHLVVDGSTIEGSAEYPTLSYNLVTVSGVENPLTAPVYMVKLNTASMKFAGREDVTLTLAEIPGFALEVPAGSVTFPDGAREGYLSVTVVNSSKVPMPPPNGMQPQFIVTIQPTGAMFDPPAKLTLPNVDGHAPGRQVEMFSYDHDLEEFVAIGLGTVSKDGKTVTSNPGVGVVKAGWHCGALPWLIGLTHNCPTCYKCENATCVYDAKQDNRSRYEQVAGDCQTVLCSGALKDEPMDRPPIDIIRFDCKQPGCDGGTPSYAKDPADDISEDQKADCKECDDGELNDLCNKYAQKNMSEKTLGQVSCCKGVVTPFLNDDLSSCINCSTDTADAIANMCTMEHEVAHTKSQFFSCPEVTCGSEVFYEKADIENLRIEHCDIYQKNIDCLYYARRGICAVNSDGKFECTSACTGSPEKIEACKKDLRSQEIDRKVVGETLYNCELNTTL